MRPSAAAATALMLTAALHLRGPVAAPLSAQDPAAHQDSTAGASVRCPERSAVSRDSAGRAAECRVETLWVVTMCSDSAYATYQARPGADSCLPTLLPGVGAVPGARGSRAVICAGNVTGYAVVRDRVGDRDRCERGRRTVSPPARVVTPRSGE